MSDILSDLDDELEPSAQRADPTGLEDRDYLRSLDESDVEVSDWEAEFIESNLNRTHFSRGQKEIIDQMREKYG